MNDDKNIVAMVSKVLSIRVMKRMLALQAVAPTCFAAKSEYVDAVMDDELDLVMRDLRQLLESLADYSPADIKAANNKMLARLKSDKAATIS